IQIIFKNSEPTSLSKIQNDTSKTTGKKQKKGTRLNAGIPKKQSLRSPEHLDENSLKRKILSKNDPKVESKAPSSVGNDTDVRGILPCEEVSNTTVGDESVEHSKEKPATATRLRKQFRCPHCSRTFKNPSYWRDHVATHSGIKNFTCQVCDKGFYSIVKLNIHAKTHTAEKDCLCSTCGKVFKKKCELRKHAQIHSERPLFLCNVCGKSFKTNHYLKSHLMVHSGEKNFVCTVCGKAFTWHVTLVTHSKVHKAERPVSCTLCSKAFKRREVMLKHMRVHTGEKSYKCLFCDRGFTDKWNLTQHVRIHTGDKPYRCDVCNQAFTYNVSLKTHIQQRHPHGAITPKLIPVDILLSCPVPTHVLEQENPLLLGSQTRWPDSCGTPC
ncbi:unnamed protein product, partial [Timema podura]|nr:unnamed protein product [Timema podura]